jgi:oligoendopeptidase F
MRTEFQQKVLNVRNYSGYTDKPKYSSMMESKMSVIYNSIIFPILRENWTVVMDRLDQLQTEYCGYSYIQDYDEHCFNLVDILMTEYTIPMSWGGTEEEEEEI